MLNKPLRYNISDWSQLSQCKSNNNKYLTIRISHIHDDDINGMKIAVHHGKYGDLFACIVNPAGKMFTYSEQTGDIYQLSTESILKELDKFGFIVSYNPRQHLSGDLLSYLITIRSLKYDKIRRITVWHNDKRMYKNYVVGFKSEELPNWLSNSYRPPLGEFKRSLVDGSSCNISMSPEGKKLRWDWLDFVANIDDILDENKGV